MAVSAMLVAVASQESTTACLTSASTVANTGAQPATGAGLSVASAAGPQIVLASEQVKVAQAFIGVGKQLSVSDAGLQIVIMVGLQESGLRMLANPSVPASMEFVHDGIGSDHDSLGSAQQRPSAGWGSVSELMKPIYDAQAASGGTSGPNHGSPRGLLDNPAWESMAKGEASSIVAALKSGTSVATCSPEPGATGAPELPANLSQLKRDIIHYAKEGSGAGTCWLPLSDSTQAPTSDIH